VEAVHHTLGSPNRSVLARIAVTSHPVQLTAEHNLAAAVKSYIASPLGALKRWPSVRPK